MRRATAVYRTLLHGYPASFRHEYGQQMCLMFAEQLGEARRTGAWRNEAALWVQAAWDLFTIAAREHWHVILQDLGRLFTITEDRGEPASAVISHAYWQRRFGGGPDVIGKTLIVRDTPVSIVGVAPAAFVGETSGQQPDLWLPLRLQPRVLPGGD